MQVTCMILFRLLHSCTVYYIYLNSHFKSFLNSMYLYVPAYLVV